MTDRLSLRERPNLETERLYLRRPDERDVDVIARTVGDWNVARRLARIPHPYGLADARFFLEQVVPAEWLWGMTLKGCDDLIGVVGLTPKEQTAELGYWLAPRHWGRGVMTEAARSVVSFGFDELDLPYLTSGYFVDNPASGRVLNKLGFVEVGRVMRRSMATRSDVPSVQMHLQRSL